MKGFMFSSNCFGSPPERFVILQRIFKRTYSLDQECFHDEMIRFSSRLNQMDENVSMPVKLLRRIRE